MSNTTAQAINAVNESIDYHEHALHTLQKSTAGTETERAEAAEKLREVIDSHRALRNALTLRERT